MRRPPAVPAALLASTAVMVLAAFVPLSAALGAASAPPSAAASERGIEWQDFVEAPFLRAQATNRPILLCVTVRWSQPANRALAELLNRPDVRAVIESRYVPVLVDADLRPDVRERFPAGSWPAITLLNPVGDPIVYQREKDKPARRMTLDLAALAPEKIASFLRESADYYRVRGAKGPDIDRQAADETVRAEREKKVGTVDAASLEKVGDLLRGNQDVVNGGFGRAPKFLVPTAVESALMLYRRKPDPELLALAERSLHAAGGLEDPVEGGLHRLAANEDWTGLQYEKLLSRNADALDCYVDAWKTTLRDDYRQRAGRIASWIVKTLSLPEGGFSFGQTADFASTDGGGYYRASATERAGMKRPQVLPVTLTAPSAHAAVALLRYAELSGDETIRQRALGEIRFLDDKLYTEGRGVQHGWQNGTALGPLLLEDQLAFIAAHLEAWSQTGIPSHLERALETGRFVRDNLSDSAAGMLVDRIPQRGGPTLLQAPLHSYELNCEAARLFAHLHYLRRDEGQAVPQEAGAGSGSGNVQMELVRQVSWAALARDLLESAAGRYPTLGPRAGDFALAASEYLDGPTWIFLVGDPNQHPDARALLDSALRLDLRFAMAVVLDPDRDAALIEQLQVNRHGAGEALYFSQDNLFSAPARVPEDVGPAWKALVKTIGGGKPK